MTGWDAPGRRWPGPLGNAGQPPEVLVVAGLVAAAGLCLFLPALSDVPDRISLVTDGIQVRYVPALLVSTLVSLVIGAACFGVAYALYTGDKASGLLALGYAAALAPALLFGFGRDGNEVLALLLLGAGAAVLLFAPVTKPLLPWSPEGRADHGPSPRSIRAAWFLGGLLSAVAGAIGLSSVLAFSSASLAGGSGFLTGLFLLVFGVVGLGSLGPVKAGSINGRLTMTVAMGGVIAAILIDYVTQDLAVWTAVPLLLMALAAVVILLLWLAPDAQGHFVRSDLPLLELGRMSFGGPGASRPSARRPGPIPTVQPAPPPAESAYPPPTPPRQSPAESSWSSFEDHLDQSGDYYEPPQPAPPPPARVFHEAVGVAQETSVARSAPLELTYDQQSWFAVPDPGEQVYGALLVSMLMIDHGPEGDGRVFQGSSTLIVTDRRLAGVCPKGSSAFGTLDARSGPVVLWSVPVGSLDRAELASSSSGPHLSITRTGDPSPWLLLAKPRLAEAGSFRPADIGELAEIVDRAIR